MKQGQKLLLGVMLLSVVITVILLQFMPDQIPAHYNAAGAITRMGTKYESLIWPGLIVVIGGLFLLGTERLRRSLNNEMKYLYAVGAGVELLFLALGVFYMIRAIGF